MTLPELLQRCAEGDEELQTALLDEVEPLVFGYLRSLIPGGEESFERAVALTHAAALGFLLDLRGGRVRISDAAGLRGACHRIAVAVLRIEDASLLNAEGDPETGALTPVAVAVAQEWERVLDDAGLRVAAGQLQGRTTSDWIPLVPSLMESGLLRRNVPDRDAT